MSRLNDFIVNITLAPIPPQSSTFGNILIYTSDVNFGFKVYTSMVGVSTDFASTTATYKMADQLFKQTPAPASISVFGKTILVTADITAALTTVISMDWMVLYSTVSDSPSITAISSWALSNNKYYAATTQDLTIFSTIRDKNTFLQYHSIPATYLAESLITYLLVRPIGSCNAKFKQLVNMSESIITDTDLATLKSNNGGTYIKDMGALQTTSSKCQSGEYYDVVLGAGWIKLQMESNLRNLALSVGKIPYTNTGISMVINAVESALKQATQNGIISTDDSGNAQYSITYKKREDVAITNIAIRKYADVVWTAKLSGAIETATISGTLTV